MWRPTVKTTPYDFITNAERQRLLAKWRLFQARRRPWKYTPGELALLERNVAYYDQFLPQWRAERAATDAAQARMLRAADGCVATTDAAIASLRAA